VLLTAALMASALLLVTSQYQARRLNMEFESAQGQEQELHVRTRQLELRISEYAKASLIDSRVRKELNMVSLTPERTLYLLANGQPGGRHDAPAAGSPPARK
jgi:cell division protein FtsL